MDFEAVKRGVALVRVIRVLNHALEYNARAIHAGEYLKLRLGDLEISEAHLYGARRTVADRMIDLFDLDEDDAERLEDKGIGEYA